VDSGQYISFLEKNQRLLRGKQQTVHAMEVLNEGLVSVNTF